MSTVAQLSPEAVAALLEARGLRVRWRPNGIKARCPLCHGRRPQLYITAAREHLLAHCCRCDARYTDIARALDLDPSAFFGYTRCSVETGSRVRVVYYQRLRETVLRATSAQRSTTWSRFGSRGAGVSPGEACSIPVLLAAYAHGDLAPLPVRLALPRRTGSAMRAVAEDLNLLFGLRFAADDFRPLPYGSNWAAERLGLSAGSVANTLARLRAARAIEQITPPRSRRPAVLRPNGAVAVDVRPARAATYVPGSRFTVAPPGSVIATRDHDIR